MMRWAAMLRGVNLGGRKLLMADLAAIAERLGFEQVRTLLASGNVGFETDLPPREIETMLEAALGDHGLPTDVLVRNAVELADVIATNPFPEAARDHPSHMLIAFHRDPFPRELLKAIIPFHEGSERLQASGRELYIDYRNAETMRASRLLQAMAKAKFPKINTARNWNTVNRLAAMLAD
jgi:uncharacterized protein (DUF1697 family)